MALTTDNKFPWGEILSDSDKFEMKLDNENLLRLQKRDGEIQISSGLQEDDNTPSRFIVNNSQQLYLDPGLPELPVVIKPKSELSILPGQLLSTYIDVPLVFQISLGTIKKKYLLKEFPALSLSRSWFGDPDSGEVAYFLESPMQSDINSCDSDYSCIHCPVSITNRSNQILSLDRMILRVPYLTIYRGQNRFYTNRTKISYTGQDQVSQINIIKTPPDVHEKLTVVSPPRLAIDSGVLHKSFYFIKTLYNG